MSELGEGRRRRRRSDADRSAAAVLEAAVRVLGRDPDATMDEVAAEAGVARQTVYAHYPSRLSLVAAVIGHSTARAAAALDAAEATGGPATTTLLSWLDVTWRLAEEYPLLRHPSAAEVAPATPDGPHAPIAERLERLIRRGQAAGEMDSATEAGWLVAATIALGHAAGGEVATGRMTQDEASRMLRHSILRLYQPG